MLMYCVSSRGVFRASDSTSMERSVNSKINLKSRRLIEKNWKEKKEKEKKIENNELNIGTLWYGNKGLIIIKMVAFRLNFHWITKRFDCYSQGVEAEVKQSNGGDDRSKRNPSIGGPFNLQYFRCIIIDVNELATFQICKRNIMVSRWCENRDIVQTI